MHAAFLTALQAHGWPTIGFDAPCTQDATTLSLDRNSFRVEIGLLAVAPDARRQGRAGRALAQLCAAADATGTRLVLSVQPLGKNRPDADTLIALYTRFGFARAGCDREGHPLMARPPHCA